MIIKDIVCFLLHGARKARKTSILTATAIIGLATTASAQHSLGLKLGINGNGNQQSGSAGALLPTDLAGAPGFAQVNWNVLGRWGDNATNGFGTNAYALLDSAGDDSHITINWDSVNIWSVANGGAPADQLDPDKNLMNAFDDSNGNANVALVNGSNIYAQNNNNKTLVYLSGIQQWLATEGASQYDLVLCADGDNQGGRTGEYWVQNASGDLTNITYGVDMTTHVFIRDYNNFTANPVYQRVPFTANVGRIAGAGNYTVFTGLSADSLLVRTSEFSTRSPINAIQLVPRLAPVGATIDPLLPANTVAGRNATFRANVAGVLPMSFQWKKNGVNLTDSGNISGSITATLNIANVSGADAASYSLVVSNAGGLVTTPSVPLTVASTTAGSYAEKIITNNPVAYWRFNEINDTSTNFSVAYDTVGGFNAIYGVLSQNGFNAVAGPRPTDFPGFEANNYGMQTYFGNTTPLPFPSSYVSWAVAPPLNLNTNTVTLCAWIYPVGSQAGSASVIFERNTGSDIAGFGYGNNNNLGYTWNGLATTFNFVSGLVPASNQWSLVALVVSPTNAILYLYNTNGQFSATNTVAHTNCAFGGLTMLGNDPSSTTVPQNRTFNGVIDEAAVFGRSLSDQELYLLYKKGLNVGIIPAGIAVQPQSTALLAGRTARLSVVASGDKPLTYQWRTNGVNLVNGGRISGATSSTLTISNLALGDAGSYDVVVDNIAHSSVTSSAATLSVVVSNSSPIAYEGALMAANPVSYWRFNETAGTSAYDYWGGNIATHTSATVGVAGPQPPDFIGFETTNVAVSYDGFTSATDTGSTLMNNRAQFSIIGWFNSAGVQAARTGLFGQNDVAEFGFHGVDGSGQAQLGIFTANGGFASFAGLGQTMINPGQWYFVAGVGDGTTLNLYLFSTNLIMQTSTSATTTNYGTSAFPFRIGGGGILDATGNYFTGLIDDVAVFNRALSLSELSTLFGAAQTGGALPPSIITQPTSSTLYAGRTAQFKVVAAGSNPAYRWRKNGVTVTDGGNVSGSTTATLTITSVAAGNVGNYDVVITNTAGTVTSSVASLAVITPTPGGFESAAIALNPYAYWRLNETTGTTAYDFWGGHNGTYATAASMGVFGVTNPPFSGFESTNTAVATFGATPSSYVSVPFGSLSTNTVTFTAWLYPIGDQVGAAGILNTRGNGVSGGFNYGDGALAGKLGYTWNNNNANTWGFDTGILIPTNQWSFVAVVISPSNAVFYLYNATTVLSSTNAIPHTADVFGNNWQIGHDDNAANNDGTRTFNGIIDEVVLYLQSLTGAQIQQLYLSAGLPLPVTLKIQPSGANVVLTWPVGTLLEAPSVTGPWTTNTATSPYTTAPSAARKFYRVQVK